MVAARAFTAAARSTITTLHEQSDRLCALPVLPLPHATRQPGGLRLLVPLLVLLPISSCGVQNGRFTFALGVVATADSPAAINCHCTEFNSPHFMAAPEGPGCWVAVCCCRKTSPASRVQPMRIFLCVGYNGPRAPRGPRGPHVCLGGRNRAAEPPPPTTRGIGQMVREN